MRCESVRGFLRQTVACTSYPFAPPLGWSYVDLADTAAAHTLAMLTPGASGRCRPSSLSITPHLGSVCVCERMHVCL